MREQPQSPSYPGKPDSPGTVARRLGDGGWRNGRLALGVLLVLAAVLGGAAALRQADQTVAVVAASRDLPSGVPLTTGDLRLVRVRLPAAQLARYARPGTGLLGATLTNELAKDALVPIALLAQGPGDPKMVEYPIPVEPSAIPGSLRPGDRVAVVVAGGERSEGLVLLRSVEVIRLLTGGDGFADDDRVVAIEVRMPKERLGPVAAAIADGHVSVARLSTGDVGDDGDDGDAGAPPLEEPVGARSPTVPTSRVTVDGRAPAPGRGSGDGGSGPGRPEPNPSGGTRPPGEAP